MNIQEQLELINQEYYKADGENKAQVIEALKKIHVALLRNPEELKTFIHSVIRLCGGCYIPYVFWLELVKFIDGNGDSALVYQIIEAFCQSDFEEEELHKMKPLLVIYFSREREFEQDRIKAYIVDHSHKTVREYFAMLYRFVAHNTHSVQAYTQKLHLLKRFYPNFELFDLSVQELEAKLSSTS